MNSTKKVLTEPIMEWRSYATKDFILQKKHIWYLIRTKQHKEPLVHAILSKYNAESFLPMIRVKQALWGKARSQLVPLFPGYVFAHFDLEKSLYSIQRTHGVVGVVCAGSAPCEIPKLVIEEIRQRQKNGAIELPDKAYCSGQIVQIVGGSLGGIHAVFEKYICGADRVAVLLKLIGGTEVRAVLPFHRIRNVDA
jgi:transcriptional antiterminator RfaH